MKILVISDSHHFSLASIPFEKYDAILHCGDYGNSLEIFKKNMRSMCKEIVIQKEKRA